MLELKEATWRRKKRNKMQTSKGNKQRINKKSNAPNALPVL